MDNYGEVITAGVGLTVTVTCADAVHPLLPVPITVYVVVEVGCALTFGPVDELRDADGLHVKVFAPPAVSAVLCPLQIVSSGETKIAGDGFTVKVSCADEVQPDK